MSTPVEVVTSGSVQDVAISGLSSGWLDLSEESMTRVGELVTLARPSLSEVSATRADRASLDLSEESMTRVGSAVYTILADRVTLGLDSLGASARGRQWEPVSERKTMGAVACMVQAANEGK